MSEDAVLGALLSDTRLLVRRLFDEPLSDADSLGRDLSALAQRIRAAAGHHSLADWQTGLELVEAGRELLARWPALDHHGRRLVHVAVRYLVLEDDGDSDLDSPFGFDDDREVLDAVRRALDAPDPGRR